LVGKGCPGWRKPGRFQDGQGMSAPLGSRAEGWGLESENKTMNDIAVSPWVQLLVSCVVVGAASFAGGAVPFWLALTHTRLQVAVSMVAGLMFGLALLQLFPHAAGAMGSVEQAAGWIAAGFLVMLALQRFLPFPELDALAGQHALACGHAHLPSLLRCGPLGWIGVALGLSLHSIFDGLALAASVAAADHGHGHGLGVGTSLAVVFHKPFCALSVTTLMVAAGTQRRWYVPVNLAFALVTPLAALAFYWSGQSVWEAHPAWLGAALAFCAGTFLCIACADLLPELQFHAHDRTKLTVALVVGVALAVWIGRHAHPEHGSVPHAHDPVESPHLPAPQGSQGHGH